MEENFIAHLEETLERCNKTEHTLTFTRPVTLVNSKWYAEKFLQLKLDFGEF